MSNKQTQILSQEEEKQQLTLDCFICNKPITLRGYFYIVDDQIRYFHGYHDEKTIDNLALLRNCKYCGKKFKYELFNNRRNTRQYCSRDCSNKYKSVYPKRKVSVPCYVCKKEFSLFESALAQRKRKSLSGRLYCSKSCARMNRKSRLDKFTWCDMCTKWILKNTLVVLPKGTERKNEYITKKDNYFCPKCNNRLFI